MQEYQQYLKNREIEKKQRPYMEKRMGTGPGPILEAAEGGRIGFANGNGVADEDAEKAALGKRVRELMDDGFDFGEAVKQAMSEGYAEGGRIGFSKGKLADAARRKFMKAAGTGAAGLAALKTGLIGLGEKAAPVVEKVVETAQGVPPYFFDLVAKIKMFGKPGTTIGPRQNTMNYKNYELMEDVSTGDLRITKQKGDPEIGYEQEVMEFRKGQRTEDGMIPDEYDEATIRPDGDGKMKDFEDGIEPDSIKEIMEEVTETITKKASGGIARMLGE